MRTNLISMFFGVPTVYRHLLGIPEIANYFCNVRYCFSTAAPLSVTVAKQWQKKVGLIIHQGYGLTETSSFATYSHDSLYRDGSVGTSIENVEMKIVDVEGQTLAPGITGEIAIKGPNVMLGYFRRPKENAEAIRDGWLLTRHVGQQDSDGYFYLIERANDALDIAPRSRTNSVIASTSSEASPQHRNTHKFFSLQNGDTTFSNLPEIHTVLRLPLRHDPGSVPKSAPIDWKS